MSQLHLKSKVLKTCDYSSIDISAYAIPLKTDQVRYERDLNHFLKGFAEKTEAKEVEKQDIVTLSCSSRNPKFQKEHLVVRVGLGLYSKELETELVGLSVQETQVVMVGGSEVEVTIEKILREVTPELTDELAVRSGLTEVKNAEDVRTYCRYKQYDDLLEEPADEAFSYLAGQVVKNSVFELDAEELAVAKEKACVSLETNSMFEGKHFADVTEEECAAAFGVSKQVIMQQMEQTGEYMLKAAVLGQEQLTLTDEDYDRYLSQRAAALERSVEEVRKEVSMQNYLLQTYSDFFLDKVEGYVFKKLKEIGEKIA